MVDLYLKILSYDQLALQCLNEAVLLTPGKGFSEGVEFYEATCRSRGFNVRVFSDDVSALEWLAA